jgi:hypothetical protein
MAKEQVQDNPALVDPVTATTDDTAPREVEDAHHIG